MGLIAGNNAPEAISVLLPHKSQCSQTIRMALLQGTGQLIRYSELLRAGRFWDRFPVEARFSAHVQTSTVGPIGLLHDECESFR